MITYGQIFYLKIKRIFKIKKDDENETFATLFANTLLHDDFSKDPHFDCLGLDNLQLSYNTIGNPLDPTSLTTNKNDSPNTSINFIQITDSASATSEALPPPPQLTELQSLNLNDTVTNNKTTSDTQNPNIFNDFELKLDIHEANTTNLTNSAALQEDGQKVIQQAATNLAEHDHVNKDYFESNFLIKQLTDLTTADSASTNIFLSPTQQKSMEDDCVFKKPLSDHVYISAYNNSSRIG